MSKLIDWINNTFPSGSTSASLLGAGLNMAGSIGSTIANQAFAREQMKWNSNEAQKQRDYQTSMWNATNEYNSPQQVVQRMRDAGLNPLNGIGDVNQAQAMSGSQANTYARNEMANPLASIDATTSAQIGLINAQTRNAQASTDLALFGDLPLKQAQTAESYSKIGVNEAEAKRLGIATSLLAKEVAWYDDKARTDIRKQLVEIGLTEKQADVAVANYLTLMEKLPWISKEASAGIAFTYSQKAETDADISYKDLQNAKTVSYNQAIGFGIDMKAGLASAGIDANEAMGQSFIIARNAKGQWYLLGVDMFGNGKIKNVNNKTGKHHSPDIGFASENERGTGNPTWWKN